MSTSISGLKSKNYFYKSGFNYFHMYLGVFPLIFFIDSKEIWPLHRLAYICPEDHYPFFKDGNFRNYSSSNIEIRKRDPYFRKSSNRYKGVTRQGDKYRVRLKYKSTGEVLDFGLYKDERQAAYMYDLVAYNLYGFQGIVNFELTPEIPLMSRRQKYIWNNIQKIL